MRVLIFILTACAALCSAAGARAAAPSSTSPDAEVAATKPASGPTQVDPADDPEMLREGHSYHGEAFNEGPRQAAYLMEGMGNTHFAVTTKSPEAQKFFDQGVAQLHGFWYFEAERSFRQAAMFDPACAMTYWGMAAANTNNAKRAEKFIAEAVERREQASPRERLWIDAWSAYSKADPKKDKERRQALIKALENIVHEYPDDVEAKAYLVLTIWQSRGPLPISSHQAVDALIDQVLAVNPMHPVHHYRIHLWDDQKAARALKSAALGGQSQPGIAHMWHMPGHTFSKLQRYDDAAWQQEAASRTDHAYMIRDRVMPDQIHNYAHNHEWLIRDLSHVGRVRYGIELAKNLVEMPRHPKYNVLAKNGSAQYGRSRLIELLQRYELYGDLLALADTPYLEPTDVPREQVKRLRALGVAAYETGDLAAGEKHQAELGKMLAEEQTAQKEAGDKAEAAAKQKNEPKDKVTKGRNDALNPFRAQISQLEAAWADLQARKLVRERKYPDALAQLKKAGITGGEYLSRVQLAAGNKAEAERLARAVYNSSRQQVVPTANLVYVLGKCGKRSEATKIFAELRTLAGTADLDVPVMQRLQPLATELRYPADWRTPQAARADVGERPSLDSLGPVAWTPPQTPDFSVVDVTGKTHTLGEYRGRNVLVVGYLGFGCLHCVDQLKALDKEAAAFRDAGVEIVAISTDKPADLKTAFANLKSDEKHDFPIYADGDFAAFKALRAFDDFETQPLHATLLVDATGRLRWSDVGAEPFADVKFLLAECKRLLSFTQLAGSGSVAAKHARE